MLRDNDTTVNMTTLFFDHNATTPVDPRVLEAMMPYLKEQFGNASSNSHSFGWDAQSAVSRARQQVAKLLRCDGKDVVWTSGATESNNIAILGAAQFLAPDKPHFITQATEHKAVLEVFEAAKKLFGIEYSIVPVNENGILNPQELEKAVRPNTRLISIMMANNEIGAIQPFTEIAKLCRAKKIIFHADGAQAIGKVPIDLSQTPIDLLSLSAHKIYGPKGVGALIYRKVNRDYELRPLMFGGEQEKKLRPGTINVPGVVGLGLACEICENEGRKECERLIKMSLEIVAQIRNRYRDVILNGPDIGPARLSNNVSLTFPRISPDTLAICMGGVAYSSGSACNSTNPAPSHVLSAIGMQGETARTTVRLGLGRFTTPQEVQAVIEKLLKMCERAYGKAASKVL